MAQVQVLYFAAVRDLVGRSEESLELPDSAGTVGDFVRYLEQVRPAVRGRLVGVRVALNEAFAGPEAPIREGDTLALIPPVAGG